MCPREDKAKSGLQGLQAASAYLSRPSPLPSSRSGPAIRLSQFLQGPTSLPPQLTLGSPSFSSLLSLSLVYSYVVFRLTSQVTFSAKWSYIGPLPSHPDSHVMSFYGTQDFSVEHLSRFSLHIFVWLFMSISPTKL